MDGMAAHLQNSQSSTLNVFSARKRLRHYVDAALWRLRLQEGLRAVTVVVFIALILLAATIVVDRLCSFTKAGIEVYLIWGCATALGLPYILWRMASPRMNGELASVLADDRLGLNSRLSTALTLDFDAEGNAAFSEAFFAEAVQRLNGLKVEKAFPIRVPRGAPLVLLPGLLCAGLYRFMPFQDQLGLLSGQEKKRKAEEIRQTMAEKLDGRLEDLKKKVADENGEPNTQYKVSQLIERADQISKDLKDGKRNPEEAVLGLGQLTRDIEDEKEKLTQGKEFLDRLEKLKAENLNLEESALTRNVSEALKMGDPGLAAREMRKLAQKVKDDILNDPAKSAAEKKAALNKLKNEIEKLAGAMAEDEALHGQLQEISKKTMDAAQFQQMQKEIKKQLEKQGKNNQQFGDDIQKEMGDVADELERLEEDNDAKLNKSDQQKMDELDQMEEGVDEALQGAEEGEQGEEGEQQGGQKGGKGKGKSMKNGGRSMRGRMRRGQAGQHGEQAGKDGSQRDGQGGQGNQQGGKQQRGGNGGGSGKGVGHRPYTDGDAVFETKKVRGKLQSGAITGLSHFRGRGARGEAPAEFKRALQAAEQEASSSLELERIPNDAKKVVKDYFSNVNEGIQGAGANTGGTGGGK